MTSPAGSPARDDLSDDRVTLPSGLELAIRRGDGPGRPFLLVHGLASNARLWDGVGRRLLAAGHAVVAVDQRGHGLSAVPPDGYDTDTCADDLAALAATLGLVGDRAPVVAGQSWGGNVVLSLAARHPGAVAAVCCVDGGWIRLHDRFSTFEDCWAVLEPPRMDGWRYDELAERLRAMHADWPVEGIDGTLANLVRTPGGGVRARLDRDHHRSIVASMYAGDPRAWYPLIDVPVLLAPATSAEPPAETDTAAGAAGAVADDRERATRDAVHEALAALPHGTVRWYAGADHDLHAQYPDRLAADLRQLAASVPDSAPKEIPL